jgi:thiol-disulfide isomerase/thioredoxin
MSIVSKFLARAAMCAVFAILLSGVAFSQAKGPAKKGQTKKPPAVVGPKVTQIDMEGLRKLLKPNGKPLLINFWATWCDPCREEFPDLVKLDTAYKGKVDFITISLDDLADISTHVPKFLGEMKAEMPAYLLKTPDDDAAIALVSKDWKGNLPLTILYNTPGTVAYERNGKFKYETLLAEIDKVLATPPVTPASQK